MALNVAALDTRIKATVASTMYDMSRVNSNGYFDAEDSEEARYAKRVAMNAQRLTDYQSGEYALGGGMADPMPEDAPFYFKDYHDYYKTPRGYHPRSLNSNGGWNVIGCMSFMNQPTFVCTHLFLRPRSAGNVPGISCKLSLLPADNAAWELSGVLPIRNHQLSIDHYMQYTVRIHTWLNKVLICPQIFPVKDHKISVIIFLNQSSCG